MDLRKYQPVNEGILTPSVKEKGKEKRGRKSIPESEKKKNRLILNFTDEEYSKILKTSKDMGNISPSAYLRLKLKELDVI